MRNYQFVWIAAALVFGLSIASPAENNPWGGHGRVDVPSSFKAGESVAITYSVSNSTGTGTADFRCEVECPDGTIFTAQRASETWRDGRTTSRFNFPADFNRSSQLPCSRNQNGKYKVHSFWYIAGYGVEGAECGAETTFVVR